MRPLFQPVDQLAGLDLQAVGQPQLRSRHRLLLDHLEALLRASGGGRLGLAEPTGRAAGTSPNSSEPSAVAERSALERAFALTAARLREGGGGPLAELAPELTALLAGPAGPGSDRAL